jgi:hypothetical protein
MFKEYFEPTSIYFQFNNQSNVSLIKSVANSENFYVIFANLLMKFNIFVYV